MKIQLRAHSKFLLLAVSIAALSACSTQQTLSGSSASAGATAQATSAQALVAQVTQQEIAPAIYELAYSPRQNALFVASAGGFGPDAPESYIFRLDPQTLAIQDQVAMPLSSFGLLLDDDANRLYVGSGLDSTITVLDTQTLQPIGKVQLAQKVKGKDGKEKYPHHFRQMVLDKKNHRLYAPGLSTGDSALYVVDTEKLSVTNVLPGFGPVATGIALDEKNGRLFVSNLRSNLFEVSLADLRIAKAYQVKADQLLNLAFDSTSGRLFATDQGLDAINQRRQKADSSFVPTPGNRLVEFNPDTGAIIQSAPAGQGPIALLISPVDKKIFVTNRGSGSVTIHDEKDLNVSETVELKDHPNSLAWDAQGRAVFVSVKNGRERPKNAPEKVARIVLN